MKVLVVDDAETISRIREDLAGHEDVSVVATTDGPAASRVLLGDEPPDMAILNCVLPGADGIELCKKVREQGGKYTQLVLVSDGNVRELAKALLGGFADILFKPIGKKEIVSLVEKLRQKEATENNEDLPVIYEPLTSRQLEILHMLAEGNSNSEIADQLGVKLSTVKTHVHHIFGKLAAGSRTKALLRARRLRIV